jgi:membrane fusion protein, multidrug efflux system
MLTPEEMSEERMRARLRRIDRERPSRQREAGAWSARRGRCRSGEWMPADIPQEASLAGGAHLRERMPKPPKRMIRFLKVHPPIWLLFALVLTGCTEHAAGPSKQSDAVPVVVAKVTRQSIPVELQAIGTGQAYKTVSVESQVAGIVQEVHYQQGQFVKKGDLLLTLDNRPAMAALQQAEAALTRDKSQVQLYQAEFARYQELLKQGIVSHEQFDQNQASASSSQATVQADEAAIQTAKIQLSYCSIYAPISGVTGAQLVYPGATVKANDAPVLVVINQVSPLYVSFSVPQQYLGEVKRSMEHARLGVQATPPGDTAPENGYLTFINNAVDPATGTITLMGTFANSDHRLWPGQFANVTLRLSEQENVLVVPSQAVQAGQDGDYVYVVKPDMTVDARPLKTGRTVNNVTEVEKGLAQGETIVTDGQVRLAPGAKVYFTKGL